MKKIIFPVMLLIVLMTWSKAQVVVIANKAVSTTALSSDVVQKIFLGQKTTWDGGGKIVPVTLEGGPTHTSFLQSYVKKTPAQFATSWKQAIFTGQGIPPKSFASETDLVAYVAATKGAIGYIATATPHSGVTVLQIK